MDDLTDLRSIWQETQQMQLWQKEGNSRSHSRLTLVQLDSRPSTPVQD